MFGKGGAIANAAQARLVMSNSTVSGNLAGDVGLGGGAAVYNESKLASGGMELRFVTIADNAGGGLLNRGPIKLVSVLIAGNVSLDGDPHAGVNCRAQSSQASYMSLIANDGNCASERTVDNASVFETLLSPLADNGGRTRTHALRPDSVAIDAQPDYCPSSDQRGIRRPQDGDADGEAICDIGAYERVAE